jgi:hypothetical protein
MVTLRSPEQINVEIKDIGHLMKRFQENGDFRRLARGKPVKVHSS